MKRLLTLAFFIVAHVHLLAQPKDVFKSRGQE